MQRDEGWRERKESVEKPGQYSSITRQWLSRRITDRDLTMNAYLFESKESRTTTAMTSALFSLVSFFAKRAPARKREQQYYSNTSKSFFSVRVASGFSSLLLSSLLRSRFLLHLLKFRRAFFSSPSPTFIIYKWTSIIIRLSICNTILITISIFLCSTRRKAIDSRVVVFFFSFFFVVSFSRLEFERHSSTHLNLHRMIVSSWNHGHLWSVRITVADNPSRNWRAGHTEREREREGEHLFVICTSSCIG